MGAKLIKNEGDYVEAMKRIDAIIDAEPGTNDCEELELLSTLVEIYEKRTHPMDLPTPIEAIRFRMEQGGLRQQDLVQYIGSRSHVSEVLRGTRSLSLRMIRALSTGLGIPANVLLQDPRRFSPECPVGIDFQKLPLLEIIKRKWIETATFVTEDLRQKREEIARAFFAPAAGFGLQPAMLRQHVRSGSAPDSHALLAWQVRVMILASKVEANKFAPTNINDESMQQLVRLSSFKTGPTLAQEYLLKLGIRVIVLAHLPKTHLDGAAMRLPDGSPVIGLTLRHDRLDNFWFTLMHEIAHIALHFEAENAADVFFDDMEAKGDLKEKQADRFSGDALIPPTAWKEAKIGASSTRVVELAEVLQIHPAIVAGRIRREKGNYKILSNLVGQGQVRKLFLHGD